MTWLEFKNKAVELGIKDDDIILFIDVSNDDDFRLVRHEPLKVSLS